MKIPISEELRGRWKIGIFIDFQKKARLWHLFVILLYVTNLQITDVSTEGTRLRAE